MNAPISTAFAHLSERSQLTRTGFFLKHDIRTIRDIKDLNNTQKWIDIINDSESINTKLTRATIVYKLASSEFGSRVTTELIYQELMIKYSVERNEHLMSNKKNNQAAD